MRSFVRTLARVGVTPISPWSPPSWSVKISRLTNPSALCRATFVGSLTLLVTLVGSACSRPAPAVAPTPKAAPSAPRPVTRIPRIPISVTRAPLPPVNPKLPPVPEINGSLAIKVIYPPAKALIASRDSNFIFGSVGNGTAGLRVNGVLVPVWPNGSFMGWVANPPEDQPEYELVAFTAKDTVSYVHPIRVRPERPTTPPVKETITVISPGKVAMLRNDSLERTVADTDHVVIGRPTPTGIYQWFLFPGTIVKMTGQLGDKARVLLDSSREIWVDSRDVVPLASNVKTVSEKITLKDATLIPASEWIDFRVPVSQPPAYAVEQPDANTLTLIYYNTTTDPDEPLWSSSSPDSYLTRVTVKRSSNRTLYTFTFAQPVYGYLAMYQQGAMTFRIRRPPLVSPDAPLRGMTIVVDAGHPPAGATGPTGLYEPVPNLAVAEKVRDMLVAKGANVLMTRTNNKAVALGDRPIFARQSDAHALVSIHLNALPDGQNPFRSNGTSTYYFQPHSKQFATFMQRALVPQLGLRDLGVFRGNLALVRPTWMPSVLAEGAFIIMPDQEAALRTSEYQQAYATGIVNGLEAFFSSYAR